MPTYRSPHKNLMLGFEDSTVSFTDGILIASGALAKQVESHSAFNKRFFKVAEKKEPKVEEPAVVDETTNEEAVAAEPEADAPKRRGRAPKKVQTQEGATQ